MTRSPLVLAAVALLGIAVCVLVYRLVRADGEPPASRDIPRVGERAAPAGGATAALRRQVARLDQEQSQARDPWAVMPEEEPVVPPGVGPAHAPLVPGSADVREARAEEERMHRQYIAGIEAAFLGEATDPQWSSATSSAIQAIVAADDSLRGSMRALECRSSTCRVEIADDGSGTLDRALPMFVHQLAPQLPGMAADRHDDGRGTASMVLYLSVSEAEPPEVGSQE
jgi:hypothetical protein